MISVRYNSLLVELF